MKPSMDSEAIEEQAARWFAKRESGAWTDTDQVEFDAWLGLQTAHRIAYLRLDVAWKHLARMNALGAGVPPGTIPARGSWGDTRFFRGAHEQTNLSPVVAGVRPAKRTVRLRVLSLAASVVVAVTGGLYIYASGLFVGDRYSTPVGGIDTVALEDGSRVILNTNSQLRVELLERERRIALSRGEAFFEVAHDPTRPFVVEAGNKRVVAVGTKFSVRRENDDIQVVVTEGKVRVETRGAAAGEGTSLVSAGGVARTAKDAVLVRPDAVPDVEKLLSWRAGYISFENMALADAVAEFNRYSTRKIIIEDPAIAALRLSGNFRSNNADAFLWLLQSGFPITVEQSEDKIVLRAR